MYIFGRFLSYIPQVKQAKKEKAVHTTSLAEDADAIGLEGARHEGNEYYGGGCGML